MSESLSEFDRANVASIVSGMGDWFSCDLIRLIARADSVNREILRRVYPEHVEAVEKWRNNRDE